jgi:hypothetical protein
MAINPTVSIFCIYIAYILIILGIIIFSSYILFSMMKMLLNPIVKLKLIAFTEYLWYFYIISLLSAPLVQAVDIEINPALSVIASFMTILYIHYFNPTERNKDLFLN